MVLMSRVEHPEFGSKPTPNHFPARVIPPIFGFDKSVIKVLLTNVEAQPEASPDALG